MKCTTTIPVAPINHPGMLDLKDKMIKSRGTCSKQTKVVQVINHSLARDTNTYMLQSKNNANHHPKKHMYDQYNNVAKIHLDMGLDHSGLEIYTLLLFLVTQWRSNRPKMPSYWWGKCQKWKQVIRNWSNSYKSITTHILFLQCLYLIQQKIHMYIYYTLNGKIIARLRIPTWFLIVHTVEIHLGQRVSNSSGHMNFC